MFFLLLAMFSLVSAFFVVLVHELGHLLVGIQLGLRVVAFDVGFGPKVLSFVDKRGIQCSLRLLPLGGYITYVDSAGDMDENNCQACRSLSFCKLSEKFLFYVAGPSADFLLFGFIYALGHFYLSLYRSGTIEIELGLLLTLSGMSLFNGVFNLLPFEKLDGGKILKLITERYQTDRF